MTYFALLGLIVVLVFGGGVDLFHIDSSCGRVLRTDRFCLRGKYIEGGTNNTQIVL